MSCALANGVEICGEELVTAFRDFFRRMETELDCENGLFVLCFVASYIIYHPFLSVSTCITVIFLHITATSTALRY